MPGKVFRDNREAERGRLALMGPPGAVFAWRASIALMALLSLLMLQSLLARPALAQPIPQAASAFRADLVRNARVVWGLEAPVAVFAAQVHQESGWRPRAVSHVGAQGLAQFMPDTTAWIAGIDPALSAAQPFSPAWALRALVSYDRWLWERTPAAYGPRDRMWVALRAYNGGLGHWQAEARMAGASAGASPSRAAVDAACGKARRHASHCAENLGYPHRILVVLQPRYLAWGPGL